MSDQSLGTVVGVQATLLAVSATQAARMTFLPSLVPRTEPPVQLREVGSDRGHLLTKRCSNDVEPGMRIAAAVA